MGFVQKYSKLHFDYTTQALSDTPVNYRLVYDKYLEGNQNFVYSDFVYFFVDTDSEQILASTGRYFVTSSRSGRLYREDFREFMDTYARNQGVNWAFSAYVSTDSSHLGNSSPSLEAGFVTNPSYYYESGDYFLHMISNFKYHIAFIESLKEETSSTGHLWVENYNPDNDKDSQPSLSWWQGSPTSQSVRIFSDVEGHVAVPESGAFDNALEIVGTSLSGLTSLLDHQLIGGLSIGAIIAIPLSLTLIITIIKALRS